MGLLGHGEGTPERRILLYSRGSKTSLSLRISWGSWVLQSRPVPGKLSSDWLIQLRDWAGGTQAFQLLLRQVSGLAEPLPAPRSPNSVKEGKEGPNSAGLNRPSSYPTR